MLVLSRKRNERIVIGDGPDAVVLTVVDVGGGKVRLGVDARKDLPVRREELIKRNDRRPAA